MMQANRNSILGAALIAAMVLVFSLLAACAEDSASLPGNRHLRDLVGVTHVAGKYHLSDKPFLGEGADQILALGSRLRGSR